MRSDTRFSEFARLIRLAAVLTMIPIAADGFRRDASAAVSGCEPKILNCMGCPNPGGACSYGSCEGTQACIDCTDHDGGTICLIPIED